jgi:hypothetical protein
MIHQYVKFNRPRPVVKSEQTPGSLSFLERLALAGQLGEELFNRPFL